MIGTKQERGKKSEMSSQLSLSSLLLSNILLGIFHLCGGYMTYAAVYQ